MFRELYATIYGGLLYLYLLSNIKGKSMTECLKPIIDTLKFSTTYLKSGFEGMSNTNALNRVIGGCPMSFSFVIGHIVTSRYGMAKLIGCNVESKWVEHFGGNASCNDGEKYPDILEIEEEFNKVSDMLIERLENMTEEEAKADIPNTYPMMDKTVLGGITFLTWHDSYHMGQAGAIRTALGMTSIKDLFM